MVVLTPDILYRYRHFSGENRARTAKILTDSVLYFPSPASFNDPFDCKVHFRLTASKAELQRKFESLLKENTSSNRAQRRTRASQELKSFDRKQFLEKVTNDLQINVDKTGVLSLSRSYENVLLWSHYAAGHEGLCLGFSVAADAEYFARALPVTYSAEYPEIDLLRDSTEKHVEAFHLTKAAGWDYEQEWRIIDHDTGPGEKRFLEQALVKVVLGARMSPDDRVFVVECLKRRKHPVSIFEALADPGSYKLDFRPYEP